MLKNPYYFSGALDPVEHRLVLVPRQNELNRVIDGINHGHYWAILGPREIGKTTMLRQIEEKLKEDYHIIHFNLQGAFKTDDELYQGMIEKLITDIPNESLKLPKGNDLNPQTRFLNFLENFNPTQDKKIILQFDEIEGIPSVMDFCKFWRAIYHNRFHKKQLSKYCIIIAGAEILNNVTTNPNSPFNIAKKLYMRDFSNNEAEQLIDIPFKALNIDIEPNAKNKIISQMAGHPKMLQETCFNLVEHVFQLNRPITEKDVEAAIDLLFIENTTIDTLRYILKNDEKLTGLLKSILSGSRIKFHPYKEYSLIGPGPIIDDEESNCTIRNAIFEKLFWDTFDTRDTEARFEMLGEIGRGGMGIVFKAKDNALDRTVALKKLHNKIFIDKNKLKSLFNEARASAKLKHKNIVRIYDVRSINDEQFIVMEFVEGENYKSILEHQTQLPIDELILVAKSLFSALDFSHEKGIVHHDIKPQNIMKDRDGEIKILDFGIVSLGDDFNSDRYFLGTPAYIPPEQIIGEKIDHQADIYAAGITLFELAAGEVPFKGKNKEDIFLQHLYEKVPNIRGIRPDIPFELAYIIEKCLEKNKENRFQSAAQALEKIESIESLLLGEKNKKNPGDDKMNSMTAPLPPDYYKKSSKPKLDDADKTDYNP